jgi:hypothetical protein
VRLPRGSESRRIVAAVLVGASLVLASSPAVLTAQRLLTSPGNWNADYEIASGLLAMGLRAGDHVGTLGWAYDAYWARLARVRIVAETPQPDVVDFWSETPEKRRAVYDAFRKAGARLLLTEWVPATATADGWRAASAAGWYAYWLDAPGGGR